MKRCTGMGYAGMGFKEAKEAVEKLA